MTGRQGSAIKLRLRRAAVLAGCLGFSVLALGSGFDRQTRISPATASRVPAVFAHQALLARAKRELSAGNYAAANDWAKRAVLADPIEPASTALLGATRIALGDLAGADQAFRVAGNFGWRAAPTQFYWMGEALNAGDIRVAAQHLDALLRQDPDLVAEQALMAPLEQDPRGRTAIVDRLIEMPDWLINYTSDVYNLTPEVTTLRAQVLIELARRGHPLGCSEIGQLTKTLIANDKMPDAYALWRAHCPSQGGGLIADASFAGLEVHQTDSPFAWMVIGDSDVSVNLEPDLSGPGRHLVVASSASFARKVLTQLVMVPAGTYRLTWRALTPDGKPSRRVAATFACNADSHEWLPATLEPGSSRWFATVQVSGSCAGHWLGFTLQSGSDSVNLDQISLEPAR